MKYPNASPERRTDGKDGRIWHWNNQAHSSGALFGLHVAAEYLFHNFSRKFVTPPSQSCGTVESIQGLPSSSFYSDRLWASEIHPQRAKQHHRPFTNSTMGRESKPLGLGVVVLWLNISKEKATRARDTVGGGACACTFSGAETTRAPPRPARHILRETSPDLHFHAVLSTLQPRQ